MAQNHRFGQREKRPKFYKFSPKMAGICFRCIFHAKSDYALGLGPSGAAFVQQSLCWCGLVVTGNTLPRRSPARAD
jgi:hypothetical protein